MIVWAGLDHTGEYLLFTDEEAFGIGKMGREMPAGSTAQTRTDVEYPSTQSSSSLCHHHLIDLLPGTSIAMSRAAGGRGRWTCT